MNKDDFILDLPEWNYDSTELGKILEDLRPNFRLKNLPWRAYNIDENTSEEELHEMWNKTHAVVIQYGEHMIADKTKSHLSVNLLDYKIIRDLAERINFDKPISPYSVDINWYKSEDFYFEPHVDYYAASTMIFPITPLDNFQPIDFYDRSKVNYVEGETFGFDGVLTDNDIIYTHHYTPGQGAIFNSHWPHGIRRLGAKAVHRAGLRFRTDEKFSSIMKKYKEGRLFKW